MYWDLVSKPPGLWYRKWKKIKLDELDMESKTIHLPAVDSFNEQLRRKLVTRQTHLLDYIMEDIYKFGTPSILDAPGLVHSTAQMRSFIMEGLGEYEQK